MAGILRARYFTPLYTRRAKAGSSTCLTNANLLALGYVLCVKTNHSLVRALVHTHENLGSIWRSTAWCDSGLVRRRLDATASWCGGAWGRIVPESQACVCKGCLLEDIGAC